MPRRRLVALLVTTSLLTAACIDEATDSPLGSGDTTTTTGDGGPTTTAGEGPGGFTPAPIAWEDCQFGECATIEVPLDYDDPDGERIELAAARAPATGDRIGALFVNPGGPGASATDFAATLAFLLPGEINEHFDIVGIDPRGVGGSTPIDCGVDPTELYGVDATIEDDADRARLL